LLGSTEEAGNRPEGPDGRKEALEHRNDRGKMAKISGFTTVSTKLEWLAKLVREMIAVS
jgi:hypothetical protein